MALPAFDPTDPFSFVPVLEAQWEVLREEMDRLTSADFLGWPLRDAVAGGEWLIFPLMHSRYVEQLDVDIERNQRLCPRTVAVMRTLPTLVQGGFSRLMPGAHILPHVDAMEPDLVRCHLGLRIPGQSKWRTGGPITTLREGRCTLLNGLKLHDTANLDAEPRTIFIADFRLPFPLSEAEAAGLRLPC